MKDLNKLSIIGRLTKDAELNYTKNGTPITKFSIAVNCGNKFGGNGGADVGFFPVNFWGKLGETLFNNHYLLKGKQVAIIGSIKQERWAQGDKNQSRVIIEAESIQLIGSLNNNQNHTNSEYDEEVSF